MQAVDTNVLVRLLEQDDPGQSFQAEALLRAGGPAWVPQVVLVETVWVLGTVFRRTRGEILALLEALLGNGDLHLQEEGVVRAAVGLFRASRADFSDCLVLETARAHGHLPLVTFDRKLGRLEGTLRPGPAPHR